MIISDKAVTFAANYIIESKGSCVELDDGAYFLNLDDEDFIDDLIEAMVVEQIKNDNGVYPIDAWAEQEKIQISGDEAVELLTDSRSREIFTRSLRVFIEDRLSDRLQKIVPALLDEQFNDCRF